jgi:hypothetical protein
MQKVLLVSALALGLGAAALFVLRPHKKHEAAHSKDGACVLAAHMPVGEVYEGELHGDYANLDGEVEKVVANVHSDSKHRIWGLNIGGKEIISDEKVIHRQSKKVVELRNFDLDIKGKKLSFDVFDGLSVVNNIKPSDLLICK